jgi:phosphopantothenoylcysteine decarboxylase/phosphopantothenate--cysteine ligase
MRAAVGDAVADCDIFIAAAAVADYRPQQVAAAKVKKQAATLQLDLEPTTDILAEVAARADGPFTVGFAAETENVTEHARAKLEAKGLDLVAANRVGDGLAFDRDDNELELLWPGGGLRLPRAAKSELARQLIDLIAERYHAA